MIASSSVVLSNLAYLIGAVVFAVIGGTVVWLRHRQPKSVDANVASFNRGLRALAPDGTQPEAMNPAAVEPPRAPARPSGLRVIRTEIDLSDHHDDVVHLETGAEESAGKRAGAESG